MPACIAREAATYDPPHADRAIVGREHLLQLVGRPLAREIGHVHDVRLVVDACTPTTARGARPSPQRACERDEHRLGKPVGSAGDRTVGPVQVDVDEVAVHHANAVAAVLDHGQPLDQLDRVDVLRLVARRLRWCAQQGKHGHAQAASGRGRVHPTQRLADMRTVQVVHHAQEGEAGGEGVEAGLVVHVALDGILVRVVREH